MENQRPAGYRQQSHARAGRLTFDQQFTFIIDESKDQSFFAEIRQGEGPVFGRRFNGCGLQADRQWQQLPVQWLLPCFVLSSLRLTYRQDPRLP